MTTNAQLAAQIATLLQTWNAREAEFRDWMAGVPDGGPNGDGKYPLTDASGRTVLVDCPAKLADTVDGPAGASLAAQLAAEAARDETITARDNAREDAEAAGASRSAAQTAKNEAQMFRNEAASFASAAGVDRQAVEQAANTATGAATEADAARDETILARDATLVARADAVEARDQAQAFAEALQPERFALKTDLEAEIAALVGQSPETLNALDELAAALGNDPNFATTITNQLAGKAPLVHGHGIADVTGLQTALDGKAAAGHTHDWASILNKPSTFTPAAHGHGIADITGLQAALDGKQPAGSYASASHTHDYLPLSGGSLSGGLYIDATTMTWGRNGFATYNGGLWVNAATGSTGWLGAGGGGVLQWNDNGINIVKGTIKQNGTAVALAGHGHSISEISGLQAALDGKAAASHSHGTLPIEDTRSIYRSPNDNPDHALSLEFTNQLPGLGDWHSLLNMKGWGDAYTSWQLVGPSSTGAHENLYFRSGVNGSWNPLRTIWHSGNFDPGSKANAASPSFTGNVTTTGAVVAGANGFMQATYTAGARNPIWRFGNADPWGLSYFQGTAGISSLDTIGFHFGQTTAAGSAFRFISNGTFQLANHIQFDKVRGQLVSQYDPYQTQGIWAMGSPYMLNENGGTADYGNFYGLAWSYEPGYGGAGYNPQSKSGLSHQLLLMHSGITKTAIGNGIWTSGNIYANGNGSQPLRPNRLYRRDDTSDYSVQHHWTGSHWWLRGYVGDSFHAEVRVGYADNAGALGGYGVAEAAYGSTVAARNASGYLFATYLNQSSGSSENPTIGDFFVQNSAGDGYLRKASVAHVKNTLGVRNITVSTAGPSGGSSGDIWLKV